MRTKTTEIEYTKGLTFEKVWAMFQETDKRMQETDKRMQETDKRMQETDKRMRETDKRIDKLLESVKIVNKSIGDIGNAVGDIVESMVQGGLKSILELETGYKIHTVEENFKINQEKIEIDCLLIGNEKKTGKEVVFICECKNKLKEEDVEKFINTFHNKASALQKSKTIVISKNAKFVFVFGYSKIENTAKKAIDSYVDKKHNIYKVKVGGDGSVRLMK